MPNPLPEPQFFESFDGARLAFYEVGEGRPVVLLHGLFSNAATNWWRYGTAETIAARGFRVLMPDLRAHGASAAPRDPDAYPPDVLARDGMAFVAALGLGDYDLGGYSLGARTVVRMLTMGAGPRRVVLSGMGLQGLLDTETRAGFFRTVLQGLGSHPRGSPEFLAEAFFKTTGGDAAALLLLLDSFVPTSRAALAAIRQPVLVLGGADDRDNGSMAELAAWLPNGRLAEIPGNHMSAVTRAELGIEIAAFLGA